VTLRRLIPLSYIQKAVHSHEDDLELYVRGRLEPGYASTVESHLLECQLCREQVSRCVCILLIRQPIERTKSKRKYERSEPRFCTGDDALFQELNPLSMHRQNVKIVDVSKNGLGILARKSVSPGTIVQVRIQNNIEIGEVRYCLAFGDQVYRIGLRLHSAL
jgi:hypothetical protein